MNRRIAASLRARRAPAVRAGIFAAVLVPWNRDESHNARSAAPGSQGATTAHIGHM
jgi:hypothetical protein